MNTQFVHIDAGTFQKQLIQLAETVAQKVKREASSLLPGVPAFVSFDLHILTRQAMHTYDLFFYLNADERREKDCYWRPAFLARGASTCGRLAGWRHTRRNPFGCRAFPLGKSSPRKFNTAISRGTGCGTGLPSLRPTFNDLHAA